MNEEGSEGAKINEKVTGSMKAYEQNQSNCQCEYIVHEITRASSPVQDEQGITIRMDCLGRSNSGVDNFL